MDSPFILNLKGADSRSPLTYAVWSGNVALVTYLVNRGASVFEKDEAGAVPLHHAAFHGFPEVRDASHMYIDTWAIATWGSGTCARTGQAWEGRGWDRPQGELGCSIGSDGVYSWHAHDGCQTHG